MQTRIECIIENNLLYRGSSRFLLVPLQTPYKYNTADYKAKHDNRHKYSQSHFIQVETLPLDVVPLRVIIVDSTKAR